MRIVDLAVIVLYLAAITWFGARFRRRQKSLRDYFLGGRSTPWWAIAFSIVSAETSTLTVIGTPALAFRGNMGFLQVVLGYLVARIVICTLFLPQYFRGDLFTAYELMERRFGPRLRRLTAGLFLVLRALAEGVRVFAVSIVVSVILDLNPVWSIAIIVLLTLFYTFQGGLTAVIWTDMLQMSLYITGAVAGLFLVVAKLPGGWPQLIALAAPAGKFTVFSFHFAPTLAFFAQPYTFWAGLIGGCFLTTASHGTEQFMVQRLLAARDLRSSRKALLASWVVVALQFTLFLLIGVALWALYHARNLPIPAKLDPIYPRFIWNELPIGVAGLVMAAVLAAAMTNLSGALNSLSSTTIMDFYRRVRPGLLEAHYLRSARVATVFWAAVLLIIGTLAQRVPSVFEAGLGIASVLSGGLLGVFLLGLLTRRVGEVPAMAGMAAGLAINVYVAIATPIAFTWYVSIGACTTLLVALLTALAQGDFRKELARA